MRLLFLPLFFATAASADISGGPIHGTLDDVSPFAATENGSDPVRITPQRAEHVNLRNQAGTEVGTTTTPLRETPQYAGVKIDFDDMNVANGGVARGTGIASTTVYTTLYSYTGTGQLFSFLVSFEGNLVGADSFTVRLTIDSVDVFTIETVDIGTGNLYNLLLVGDESTMGFSLDNNVLRFAAPRSGGLYFGSNISVKIKKSTSATSKQFRAGAVYLTKES